MSNAVERGSTPHAPVSPTAFDADSVAPVMAFGEWDTNGHLIADCARLGYLRKEWRTLDPTYGRGTFWSVWRPDELVASDLDHDGVDFRALPHPSRSFDCVVFDPPYKLNGTDQGEGERYGVDRPASWQDRVGLIAQGVLECARVLDGGFLLVKCQDQVCGGKMRWQTRVVTDAAAMVGLGWVDRLDFIGGRPQPDGRSQQHARHNASQLLVFKRSW